jgi:ATP-binding cassette subfamily B protein
MLSVDGILLLAALVLTTLITFLVSWFGGRLLQFAKISQSRIANLSSLLTEVFSGIRLVKAFAAERYEIERFAQLAQKNQQARFAAEQLKALQFPVLAFVQIVGVLCLFGLGTLQISTERLTASTFASFLVAIALLIEPTQQLISTYNNLKENQASLERVFALLQLQPSVVEPLHPTELSTVTGKVEYRQVSFAYHANQPVIHNLSFQAYPGEMIALVGHSGAGKSTLVNLLLRLYAPQTGKILIDGVDISTVRSTCLRRQMGIVPQETVLFSGTIAENIGFGQNQLDMAAIQTAAIAANADSFIRDFPDGYHTWLGERGVNLSGGQRQRLAIARAIYSNPRILILDEATSALDTESEALVQDALERVMQGRTVFVIAHRLSTVSRADKILVLEQGQVVESGTHNQLLANPESRYARFYARQFPQ